MLRVKIIEMGAHVHIGGGESSREPLTGCAERGCFIDGSPMALQPCFTLITGVPLAGGLSQAAQYAISHCLMHLNIAPEPIGGDQ